MGQVKTRKVLRPTQRRDRPSLNPYVIDEVALMLAEIREARASSIPLA